jgi:hypothetical protein
VALYTLHDPGALRGATLIAAFDAWVDAGSASTTAAQHLAAGGRAVATFDPDALYDYRARRPILEIVDGRPAELEWPELELLHVRRGSEHLLLLSGPEPDYRWQALAAAVVELAQQLEVSAWMSLGAIPAAVPHTRPVPILGTESRSGLLRGQVQAGPAGLLRVPAAALSVVEMAVAAAGIPSVGYFAQIPHYVSGPYAPAALALLRTAAGHLDVEPPIGDLEDESRQLRTRLDAAAAADETTRTYVERLEAMVDEARLPSGDDLISEIERFLRDQGEGSQRT